MRKTTLLALSYIFAFADNMLVINENIPIKNVQKVEVEPPKVKTQNQPLQSSYFEMLIELACAVNGVDSRLAVAIAQVESAFNPMAVSATGAIGVMQVKVDQAVKDVYALLWNKPKTPSAVQLHDPKINIDIGVAYLGLIQNRSHLIKLIVRPY